MTGTRVHGIDALWPDCLAVAHARRSGDARQAAHDAALVYAEGQGWQLASRAGQGWDDEACQVFELLKPLLDRPPGGDSWVLGQLGQSLNGCIATHGGDANFVNGPEVLTHLHRLRALSDAVIVGAGTAALDNPQLTTRRVPGPNPVRVLLDPGLGLATTLKALSDGQAPTLLACDATRAAQAARRVGADQVLGVEGLVDAQGAIAMAPLVAALHARGLSVLFVEGGGVTVSRFLSQSCLDRLHLSVAPVVIGGGRPGLQLPLHASMRDCPRPPARIFSLGQDMLWDLDLSAARR
ncbi:RibD family protein [Variovorax dokdonensis]|uniref:RibD family protein n=1 Tax=Variovorax dokdonensis TaxID=344883 RepID=A0ABT7N5T1_9BURK|nr:RibD family protein [Variovorax dokdonensis]MDM0043262.1 RibD family protein [Variovorax dokdonensis]